MKRPSTTDLAELEAALRLAKVLRKAGIFTQRCCKELTARLKEGAETSNWAFIRVVGGQMRAAATIAAALRSPYRNMVREAAEGWDRQRSPESFMEWMLGECQEHKGPALRVVPSKE